jgi:hypothetical protein
VAGTPLSQAIKHHCNRAPLQSITITINMIAIKITMDSAPSLAPLLCVSFQKMIAETKNDTKSWKVDYFTLIFAYHFYQFHFYDSWTVDLGSPLPAIAWGLRVLPLASKSMAVCSWWLFCFFFYVLAHFLSCGSNKLETGLHSVQRKSRLGTWAPSHSLFWSGSVKTHIKDECTIIFILEESWEIKLGYSLEKIWEIKQGPLS